jgi:DNA sulfur modification protein DndD
VQRYFPNAGKQVLLLSTDEEIDADLHRLLAPAIARDYLLEHDDDRGATTIRDGYWWTQERRPA